MQNLKINIDKWFPYPIESDQLQNTLITAFNRTQWVVQSYTSPRYLIYQSWCPSYRLHKEIDTILYKIIAEFCGVKLMWRDILDSGGSYIKQGLWIIGEKHRIELWVTFLDYYLRGIKDYRNYMKSNNRARAKKAGYKSIRSYTSKSIKDLVINLYREIQTILVTNSIYESWLENVIKEQFTLDYKNYNTTDKIYYNAISNHYHHKRMLL